MRIGIMVLVLCTLASTSLAAGKTKASHTAAKPDNTVALLKAAWDTDSTLIKIEENERFSLYGIEKTAKASSNRVVTAWLAKLYTTQGRKDLDDSTRRAYYTKEKINIDCANNTLNFEKIYFYDAKGDVVNSFTDREGWHDVVPGSVGETLATILCYVGQEEVPSSLEEGNAPKE